MARTRVRTAVPGSKIGNGDFAANCHARTGRPIRQSRREHQNSPFVDSAVAISDSEQSGEDSDGDIISVAHRKRKRSPSPPLSSISDDSDSSSNSGPKQKQLFPGSKEPTMLQYIVKQVVVNVPAGYKGPILLQLDAPTPNPSKQTCKKTSALTNSSAQGSSPTTYRPTNTPPGPHVQGVRSTSKNDSYAGFLDLPAELRNEVYQHVLVADGTLNFKSPHNFTLGVALLRTCRQVYEEGRSFLYSANHFTFARNIQRRGSYWAVNWNEVGFKAVRRFLKAIGSTNIGLLRHVTLLLEDAIPCLNPDLRTADDRRFVYDENLMSVLRHLADHGKLQKLDLNFHGMSFSHDTHPH